MSAISNLRSRLSLTGALTVAGFLQFVSPSFAVTTTTTTFTAQISIVASCTINSAGTLNFSSNQGVLIANVDQTSTISVQCTSGTGYNIGLDAGIGTGATVAVRKMTFSGSTINYSLYTDAGHTTVWGNTISTDTVAATGNGAPQSYTVFGRVPPQTTPAIGTYTDTVTVTVTY